MFINALLNYQKESILFHQVLVYDFLILKAMDLSKSLKHHNTISTPNQPNSYLSLILFQCLFFTFFYILKLIIILNKNPKQKNNVLNYL